MIDVRRTLENLHQILPDLTLEELFTVLDNIVEVPQFNLGQTTIRRDASNWNPYDSGTFVSSASKQLYVIFSINIAIIITIKAQLSLIARLGFLFYKFT